MTGLMLKLKKRKLLLLFRENPNISDVLFKEKISPQRFYNWKRLDKQFLEQLNTIEQIHLQTIDNKLFKK